MKRLQIPDALQEIGAATNTVELAAFAARSLGEYALDSYWLAVFDDDLRLMDDLWRIRDGLVDRLNSISRQLRQALGRTDGTAGGYVIVRYAPASMATLTAMDLKMARFFAKESDDLLDYLLNPGGRNPDSEPDRSRMEREKRTIKDRVFLSGLMVMGIGGSYVFVDGGDYAEDAR